MDELNNKQISDLRILARFIQLFCHARHDRKIVGESILPEFLRSRHSENNSLCQECAGLLEYGIKKRSLCPLHPKPSCKSCHIHCYTPEYRAKIREIMAYSGKRMILKGRLDYLFHYWFM
jgi:YbgA-like uncharacterized protein